MILNDLRQLLSTSPHQRLWAFTFVNLLVGFFFLISSSNIFAQSKRGDSFISNGVFLADPDIREVCDFWQGYLHSKPDSIYDNPFWNTAEKTKYNTPDILTNCIIGNVYSMMSRYKPTILSITHEKGYFKIRTLYAQSDEGYSDPVAITDVFARKENGKYYLYNCLAIATKDWQSNKIGNITFICPPYHSFNTTRAHNLVSFVDSFAMLLQEPSKPTEFYFANTFDELWKAAGLDYRMGEGNNQSVGGWTDVKNNIIYGGGSAEWYPHEFVHLYANPKFKKSDPYFLEGLATFYGGTRGHSLDWLIRHADSLITANKEINIDSALCNDWEYGNLDACTGATYLFGGLLCKMAYDKGGMNLLLELMEFGPTPDEGRFKVLKDIFAVERKDSGSFLRKKIAEYAAKIPKNIE